MSKQFIAVLVVVILALFGVFTLTKKSSDNNQPGNNNSQATNQPSEHKQGAGKKHVTLIEYGDFQCPVCKSYYPIVKQIQKTYGDDIIFQFKNFPLVQLHPHAFEAARAAEAAGLQGKYWEMHDMLYENQDSWAQSSDTTTIFAAYAQQLGLNVEKFKADMSSQQVSDIINSDVNEAQAIKATGTPTFVINDKKVDANPTSMDAFKKLIDDAIANAASNN